METINLTKAANQNFTCTIDRYTYGIRLRTFRKMTYCDITENGEAIIRSLRCLPCEWLIFPTYRNLGNGNFRFETYDGHYPYWRDFGETCFLRYYSNEEIGNL